ncbi:ImmA/IrrE family metallo-endopeptidase [Phnomibacter ginsenosidimutans]|uniref:ImmA/IrrE family metallo-endopeptidase n=1 Tax=Phnomibacter ginsenosidimutans TaxID=2676868 RepID=A0A6I6GAI3_9BACT|nr:ImmA/IrrE family metallo-endopeptidase [Phnomibacter ginsenosidimutans]QGW29876.1 ImmA/IrrE family metallo-endopeptidase [Phnomibacter ginsenosidimutans]
MKVYPSINTTLLSQAAATADARLWVKFPSLQKWIDGQAQPTVRQLADFAKTVHIPFGFFFLQQLPERKNTVPLFRSGSKTPHFDYSFELSETINSIQRRQDWLVEYLRSEQQEELPFVGRFTVTNTYIEIANDIRKELKLPLNWSQFLSDKYTALKYLIKKAEDAGMYVAINGVIGNSNKNLNPEEFKGFVLSSKYAPYIFINGKDYPAAKLFTFMHELAHIWLDKSAALDIERFMPANTETERLCDAVAAELLVAETVLTTEWKKVANRDDHLDYLERFFKVSKIVIARRLLDLGIYSKPQFFGFYNAYKAFWDKKKEENGGGGSFYANQPYRVGIKFFDTVNAAAASGKLLYTDAYKLTNLYGSTFTKFKSHLES